MRIQLSDHFTYSRLVRFTLPSVATMIFTSIYGVVDGYFVSNFAGKTPFAAVNLIMPVLAILGTVGFMLGSGGTAIVAKTLGEHDREGANRAFSLIVYVAFGIGALSAVLGYIWIRQLAILFGAKDNMLEDCILYARIVLTALPLFSLQIMFQSFFVAAEKPKLGFYITLASGVTNMVLDAALCILLPQPYKLAGAAAATVASQVVGGAIPLVYFFRNNDSLLRLGRTRFDGKVLWKACTNGASEFMGSISANFVAVLFNLQLMKYAGENGVAAYGVMMYVSMIFTAAFVGYTMGIAPVISFHFGARNTGELRSLLRKSLTLCVGLGGAMVLSAELFCVPLAKLFVGYDSDLQELTVSGLRIFGLSFAFFGVGIFSSGFFTALNDGLTSALISFIRTVAFECAAVLILPMIWGVNGIWISVVVSECLAVILGAAFLKGKQKKYRY